MNSLKRPAEKRGLAQLRWLNRRLVLGVAAVALFGGVAALTADKALSAAALFSPSASATARVPAKPAEIPGFTELVAAVKPAVVSVRVNARTAAVVDGTDQNFNPFKGTPFERFFRGFPEGRGLPQSRANPQPQIVRGQGSGFFVSADGYIVTNNHVVNNAVKVEVVTDDGATLEAKVIGTDPKTDLALIKVEGRSDFPFVKLASEPPKIGEWVVAMGNPFGLGGTVTAGIISAAGRDIGSSPYDFIQIDAPVNLGNSGGPTFNLKGEVIGVNTAIYSPSGGSIGIAFDIPAATVASIIPQLQMHGSITRGWLGVQIQPVSKEIAESLGLSEAKGVLIVEPQANSPAAAAGLKTGDVIATLNGAAIKDARDLVRRIGALEPDNEVSLGIIRDGRNQTVRLKLGRLQEKTAKASSQQQSRDEVSALGLTVVPASETGGADKDGLTVVEVNPIGRAAELGLATGDVLLKADGKPLHTAMDLKSALASAKAAGHKNALILYKHNQSQAFLALPVTTG